MKSILGEYADYSDNKYLQKDLEKVGYKCLGVWWGNDIYKAWDIKKKKNSLFYFNRTRKFCC